jgi:hypothetical protein
MGSPAQPFIDMKNKLAEWANKAEEWDKPIGKKQDSTGWTPEPNEEQKRQIDSQYGRKKLTADGPKLGQKKKAAKKTAKQTARKRN